MPRRAAPSSASSSSKRARTTNSTDDQQPSTEDLNSLTVTRLQALTSAELSSHLQARSLSTSGNKAQKAQRLHDHIHADDTEPEVPLPDFHASLLEKVKIALDKHTKMIEDKLARWTSDRHQSAPAAPQPEEDNISEPSMIEQAHAATPTGPETRSPSTTSSSQSLPPVPSKLSTRILKGEYIDFKELLPENIFASPDMIQRSQPPVGTLELTPESSSSKPSWTLETPKNQSKRAVDTFPAWMQTWNTYVAIAVNTFKDRAIPMLSYQRVITNAAAKFPMSKWYEYDKCFRLKLSNDQSMTWDQVHTGLWLESFTGSSSTSSQYSASTSNIQKATTV